MSQVSDDFFAIHLPQANSALDRRHMKLVDSTLGAQGSVVTPSRYVTIDLFSAVTGLTPAAVRKRIERGIYLEGKQFRRAPDGRIWMDLQGHERWVEKVTA